MARRLLTTSPALATSLTALLITPLLSLPPSCSESSAPFAPPLSNNLMEKLSKKPYLQHDHTTANSVNVKGVPTKLRILAIDLPKFSRMVDCEMVRDSSVTFLDGLVTGKDGVKQSAWARSISRCGGTEIVSASMDGLGEGQVGWKEEMQIRLEGRVSCFSGSLRPGGWFSKKAFNRLYAWGDGDVASHEAVPQAVVADGVSLARVPNALLELSNICRLQGIPLFVVNDQRSWKDGDGGGGGSSGNGGGREDLYELTFAARNMREKIKTGVVRRAMKIKEGDAFNKGKEEGRRAADRSARFQRDRDGVRARREREEAERESFRKVSVEVLVEELGKRGVVLCPECRTGTRIGRGEENTGEQ